MRPQLPHPNSGRSEARGEQRVLIVEAKLQGDSPLFAHGLRLRDDPVDRHQVGAPQQRKEHGEQRQRGRDPESADGPTAVGQSGNSSAA